MLGFLRRRAPERPVLRALFWTVLGLLAVALLFLAFFFFDRYLPGGGMF